VAGESPDKSKQRESSAGTTSGSAGPVPEARNSTEARDPRLAVAREASPAKSATAGKSAESGPATSTEGAEPAEARPRVDTATQVLPVRPRKGSAAGTGDSARKSGDTDAGPAKTPSDEERDEAAAAAESDGRLRDAVAAWVRGADSGESPSGASGASGTSEVSETSEAGEAEGGVAAGAGANGEKGKGRAAGEDDTAAADGSSGASGAGSSGASAAEGATGGAGERAASGEAGPTAAPSGSDASGETAGAAGAKNANGTKDAPGASGNSDGSGDTTRTAEAAAKGATGAQDADRAGTSDVPGAAGKGGERAASGTAARAAAPSGRRASDEATDKAAGAGADSAEEAEGTKEDGGAEHAPAAGRTGAADATEAGNDAAGKAKATAVGDGAKAETKAETEAVRDEGGGTKGTRDKDSRPSGAPAPKGTPAQGSRPSGTPAPKGTPDKGTPDKGTAPKGAAGKGAGAGKPGSGDAGKGDSGSKGAKAERPVDQPTAVFKTVRSGPALDQATTMLRVDRSDQSQSPGQIPSQGERASSEPDRTPEPKPEAGGTAERTSRFVALKSLDDPDVRKPARGEPAAADATTALPQIGPERTAQQPLPPKPPLDLLAELTNTPPPPDTPLRTAVRRVKIWTPLVLLLVIIFAIAQAVRPLPEPTLTVTANPYVFEGDKVQLPWPDEGQGWMHVDGVGTMDHFGAQKPVAIGSVAKTMTAYVILRDHPLKPGEEGPEIEIDERAEKEGGYNKDGESTLDTVKAGDKLTLKQALSAVMIPSANNIARLLARWDAGSEAAFVKKMNDTAKELGMSDTRYTDPSGLKETTVSTAEDQVKLGRAVVKNPALVAITSVASWTDPSGKYWTNYNELPYRMGAIGIKTGSTTKAGGNLLFASREEVDGRSVTIVGAILGQHKPKILETANRVSQTALEAAENALTSAQVVKKGTVVGYVDDQLGGRTPVVVAKDVSAVGWAGLKVKLSFAPGSVPHSAEAGTEVGTLTVGDGSSSAVKVPVALKEDLVEPGFTDKLTRIA